MLGHVRAQHGSSSTSFPQRPPDITGTWRSVHGKVLSGPPCRGSWSITRASYAPPETVFNIMRNSSKCCDACSHSYVTISRRLPGLPSIWLSRSRTPWLSSWPGNKRTGRTVHNNPIMMAWMRLIVMILAPVLLPQLAVTAGHCLYIKHLVYMPIGHVVLKIYVPCKNFHVPSYYLYKSCKAYVYNWKKPTKVYKPWDKSTCPGHVGTPLCRALCPSVRCEGRQDPTPSTSMAEPPAPSVDTVAVITPEPVVPARKLKRKNAMSRQSGKKHKSPTMSLDAAPTVVAIAHIKDTPPPPKTCYNNHKNWPVVISLDRDCDTIEDWQE